LQTVSTDGFTPGDCAQFCATPRSNSVANGHNGRGAESAVIVRQINVIANHRNQSVIRPVDQQVPCVKANQPNVHDIACNARHADAVANWDSVAAPQKRYRPGTTAPLRSASHRGPVPHPNTGLSQDISPRSGSLLARRLRARAERHRTYCPPKRARSRAQDRAPLAISERTLAHRHHGLPWLACRIRAW
jgi:hypothetical protein